MVTGCDNRPDQWDAFVYPNANDLTVNETIRGFKTFELCQQAAMVGVALMSGGVSRKWAGYWHRAMK